MFSINKYPSYKAASLFCAILLTGVSFTRGHAADDAQKNIRFLNTDIPGKATLKIRTVTQKGGRLDWNPDNGLIAFDRMGADGYYDVWVMYPDGSVQRDLTKDEPGIGQLHNGQPAWHPSGKYLVFQSQFEATQKRAGKYGKGQQSQQLLDRLVKSFAAPGAGYNNNLWLRDMVSGKFWQLTDIRQGYCVLHPHFSRDGKKLIWSEMTVRKSKNNDQWAIKTADFSFEYNAPKLDNIQDLKPGNMRFYETHGFSPDDKQILFSATPDGKYKNLDIFLYDLETRSLTALTGPDDGQWDEHAHFSPDGKKIIWMSSAGIPQDIKQYAVRTDYWIMNADGSDKKRVTYFNTPGSPEFIPSGAVAADMVWHKDSEHFFAYLINFASHDEGLDPLIEVTLP